MRLKSALLSVAVFSALSMVFFAAILHLPFAAVAAPGILLIADAPLVQPISAKSLPRDNRMPAWPSPEVIIARPHLDLSDEIAALKAIQMALNDVGDGATYVWHRENGRLSGIIRPTASFRDAKRQVCRHVVVWLTAGSRTKKTETIACRLPSRVWSFEG